MSIVRGFRTLNSIEAGITDGAALEALLADGGRRGEFAAVSGMRGQAKRMADAASTVTAIAASAYASGVVMGNAVSGAEFGSNPVSWPLLRASRTAMKAATSAEPGMRQFASNFPWTARTSNVVGMLRAFAYGNGMWVGVGDGGVITTSVDGLTWVARPNGTIGATALLDIAFANGVFVAITPSVLYTSTDAITWTARTVTGATSLQRITFLDGRFVLLASNGSSYPMAFWQVDPTVTWATSQIISSGGAYTQFDIAYGNGMWVTVGRDASTGVRFFYTSALSNAWTEISAPGLTGTAPGITVAFGNGRFMATNQRGSVGVSFDGITWTNVTPVGATASLIYAGAHMLFANGVFFVPLALLGSFPQGVVCSKDNGASWQVAIGTGGNCSTVNIGNGLLLTGGATGALFTNY